MRYAYPSYTSSQIAANSVIATQIFDLTFPRLPRPRVLKSAPVFGFPLLDSHVPTCFYSSAFT